MIYNGFMDLYLHDLEFHFAVHLNFISITYMVEVSIWIYSVYSFISCLEGMDSLGNLKSWRHRLICFYIKNPLLGENRNNELPNLLISVLTFLQPFIPEPSFSCQLFIVDSLQAFHHFARSQFDGVLVLSFVFEVVILVKPETCSIQVLEFQQF